MKFHGLLNEPFHFGLCLGDCDAARKVGNISPPTRFTFFKDNHISHNYLFKPACFRTLLNVPTGMSILSLPAIVTVPGLVGW
jgi:hypothetical protein